MTDELTQAYQNYLTGKIRIYTQREAFQMFEGLEEKVKVAYQVGVFRKTSYQVFPFIQGKYYFEIGIDKLDNAIVMKAEEIR